MNFFKQLFAAIYKFESYPQLMRNKTSRVVGYLIIFTVLTAFVSLIPLGVRYHDMGGMKGITDKYIPQFSLTDGKLKSDKIDIDSKETGLRVLIDTDSDIKEDMTKSYQFYIMADSDDMYIGNGMQRQSFHFADFKDNITSDDIKGVLNSRTFKVMIASLMGVSILISLLLGTAINIVVLALIGNLVNMMFTKAQIKFGSLMKLAVYARTFPNILALAVGLIGFSYSGIITWVITITYIYIGLKNYKKSSGIIIAEL